MGPRESGKGHLSRRDEMEAPSSLSQFPKDRLSLCTTTLPSLCSLSLFLSNLSPFSWLEALSMSTWSLACTDISATERGVCVWGGGGMCVCVSVSLCKPMDCSPPHSSGHSIFQHEYWSGLPFPSPGGPSWSRDQTRVSFVSCAGRWASAALSQSPGPRPCISAVKKDMPGYLKFTLETHTEMLYHQVWQDRKSSPTNSLEFLVISAGGLRGTRASDEALKREINN